MMAGVSTKLREAAEKFPLVRCAILVRVSSQHKFVGTESMLN